MTKCYNISRLDYGRSRLFSEGAPGLIVTHSHNESVIVLVHGIAFPRFSLIYAGLVLSLPMLVIVTDTILQGKRLARKIGSCFFTGHLSISVLLNQSSILDSVLKDKI